MKQVLFVFMVVSIGLAPIATTYGATPTDVEKVISFLESDQKKALTFKDPVEEKLKAVYITNGKRYIAVYCFKSGARSLSFIIIPEGAKDEKNVDVIIDYDLSGKVGSGSHSGLYQKHFDIKNMGVSRRYQRYWQMAYDQTIADALKYFKQENSTDRTR